MASNSKLILASLGLVLLYWGVTVHTSPQNAYVQTKPHTALRTASLGSLRPGASAQPSQRQQLNPLAAAESEIVQVIADPTYTGLSVAALMVSTAALVVSVLKALQPVPTSLATGTPTEVVPLAAVEAAPAPTPVESYIPEEKTNQMDTVALMTKAELEKAKALTPKEAILELQRGNARFWSGNPERPELNAMERRAQIIAQAPTVCILSCADSRVPVELVFDQGLGRIFVVRVAGNILDSTAMGSIEFSIKYLGVKVLLVMGHEACGAVKGAMTMSGEVLDAQPAYLKSVLLQIKDNLTLPALQKIQDSRAQDREAVVQNISSQIKKLQKNALIAEREANGTLLVAGAFYEITSGIVDFYTLDKNGLVIDI